MKLPFASTDSRTVGERRSLPSRRRLAVVRWCSALLALLATLSVRPATVTWTGGNGDWSTPANWSTGALPVTNDDVVIGPGVDLTVTHSVGSDAIQSLQCQQALVLSGGSLTIAGDCSISGTFILSGGTLRNSTLTTTGTAALIVNGTGTMDGVTVNGVLDVGNTVYGASLTVTNGLVLNGTALVGNPTNNTLYGGIGFAGNQVLSGNGQVVLGAYPDMGYNALIVANAGTTLVIGAGITVRGQNGTLGSSGIRGTPQNVSVVNQGTISADVAGGTIALIGGLCKNQGTLEAGPGALQLSGQWSNDGGVISFATSSGGTVTITGPMDNEGTTLVVGGNEAGWVLQGGVIHGGTVAMSSGTALVVGQGETLDGMTLNGVLDVGNTVYGASLTVTNGLVLNGTALVGNPANNNLWGAIGFAGNQVLSGNGQVVLGAYPDMGYNALIVANAGTTLVIGAGITVRGQNGTLGSSGIRGTPQNVSVVNQGTISADVAGGTIAINANPFSNSGVTQATGGGTVEIDSSCRNSGEINANDGQVHLRGSIVADSLGTFGGTGGTFSVTGTLGITNTSVAIDGKGPVWMLNGGTILGGAVGATNGAALVVEGGTMDGVTVNGVLDVGNTVYGARLTVTNGLVLNGTALVGNPTNSNLYGAISFAGNQALSGNGQVVLGAYIDVGYNALIVANAGTALVIGAGITVRGQNGTLGSSGAYGGPQNVSVVNQGTISADVAGGTIALIGGLCKNQGTLKAGPGALQLSGQWSNDGGVISFATSSGGTVTITGPMDNEGTPLVVEGNEAGWVLQGGVIHGGTVAMSSGAALVVGQGETLDSVTVNGVLDVGNTVNGASLTVTNGLVLNGTALVGNPTNNLYGAIRFAENQVLSGNGQVVFGATASAGYNALIVPNAGTTLVIGAGITVRGQNGTVGYSGAYGGPQDVSVVNQGTISADVSGGTITVAGASFSNAGRLVESASGGSIAITANTLNTGHIEADHGAMTFSGGFIQNVGTLDFGLSSPTDFGQINFTSNADLGGTLNAQLEGGYLPSTGDAFAVLNYGANSVTFTNVTLPPTVAWQTSYNQGVLSLVVKGSPVELPTITMQPQSQTAGVGAMVTFQVTATGARPLSYQWSFNGQALPGATNAALTLTNVVRAQAGSYSVVVSNAVGSATSTPIAVLSIATGVACAGAPSGMVAWWRGEGNTGDYAGTNDAVFEGVAGYGAGEVGQAFLLDGATSYLQVPNNALWALGTNDFSIELWANFEQITLSMPGGDTSVAFIGHDEGPGAHNKWFFGFGGQELYFYFYGPSIGPHLVAEAPVNLVTNQWYHLGLTKGSGVYRIYLNGTQVSSETNSLAVPVANAPLTIGQAQGLFMDGLLDEITLYNRALAASEIQAIYQAGGRGKCGLESGSAIQLQAQVSTSGQVMIQVTGGQVGATFTVEATEDFKAWVPVGNIVKSQDVESFSDPTPVLPRDRYYRVKQALNL